MINNKLKVSTKSSSAVELERRITICLEKHPEGAFPKKIAFMIDENVNTVKSALKRMLDVKIKNDVRGLYHLVEKSNDSIFNWKFQNLILTCNIPSYRRNTIKRTTLENIPNLLKIDFGIGAKSKKATMYISSKQSISIPAILSFYNQFKLLIQKYANVTITPADVLVKTIELNKDLIGIRLDGLNCITVDFLVSQYKLYTKKQGVREEFKLKVPVGFPVLISLLKNGSLSSEVIHRLDCFGSDINKLRINFACLSQTLKQVVDYIIKKESKANEI